MKNVIKVALLAAGLFAAVHTEAQVVKKTTRVVKRTAVNVGHKTSEFASKGASVVVDKRYKTKVGPNRQTIYIDKYGRYYYVNSRGRHVYVTRAQLRNRY